MANTARDIQEPMLTLQNQIRSIEEDIARTEKKEEKDAMRAQQRDLRQQMTKLAKRVTRKR